MDHTTLNEALDKLKARGYTVTEVQYPEIRGTNDMDNPLVIVECPWYHRINTTPRMWAHLHAKEAKLASKNVYCYSCRFSFSVFSLLSCSVLSFIFRISLALAYR